MSELSSQGRIPLPEELQDSDPAFGLAFCEAYGIQPSLITAAVPLEYDPYGFVQDPSHAARIATYAGRVLDIKPWMYDGPGKPVPRLADNHGYSPDLNTHLAVLNRYDVVVKGNTGNLPWLTVMDITPYDERLILLYQENETGDVSRTPEVSPIVHDIGLIALLDGNATYTDPSAAELHIVSETVGPIDAYNAYLRYDDKVLHIFRQPRRYGNGVYGEISSGESLVDTKSVIVMTDAYDGKPL